jgi:hypothetical protein
VAPPLDEQLEDALAAERVEHVAEVAVELERGQHPCALGRPAEDDAEGVGCPRRGGR